MILQIIYNIELKCALIIYYIYNFARHFFDAQHRSDVQAARSAQGRWQYANDWHRCGKCFLAGASPFVYLFAALPFSFRVKNGAEYTHF